MRLLLIIPAFNEEECIQTVVEKLKNEYSQYDYVVINDGSTDKTKEICIENNYNCINLPINMGLATAFQTGMKYAYINGYDCAIQFDADGQHRPEYIDQMLQEIQKGYDIVIGSRFVTKKKPVALRMLGSRMIELAIKLTTGFRIKDPTSGMRLYSKNIIKEFAFNMNYGPEPDTISYLVKKRKAKIKEIQVEMDDRLAGTSYLTLAKSAGYMLRMMISIIIIQVFRSSN